MPSFPSIDLTRFDLSKLELSKLDLSKLDLSKLDLPTIDLPKVDLPKVDLVTLADTARDTARDAAYIAIGAGVLAAREVQIRTRSIASATLRQARSLAGSAS
jgi:uncharacterized protein YjbI with pentapeptide repeats